MLGLCFSSILTKVNFLISSYPHQRTCCGQAVPPYGPWSCLRIVYVLARTRLSERPTTQTRTHIEWIPMQPLAHQNSCMPTQKVHRVTGTHQPPKKSTHPTTIHATTQPIAKHTIYGASPEAQTLLIISTKLILETNSASSSNALCADTVVMPVDVPTDALVAAKRGRRRADLRLS